VGVVDPDPGVVVGVGVTAVATVKLNTALAKDPFSVRVCDPAASEDGKVTVAVTAPVADAVAVPSVTGVDWTMTVTFSPGWNPIAVNVTTAPGFSWPPGGTVFPLDVQPLMTGAGLTVNVTADDTEPPNSAAFVGMNCAVSEWLPAVSLVVFSADFPAETVEVPNRVVPSKNLTAPAAEEGDAVAVKVTLLPTVTGPAGETANVVVVPCAFTVRVVAGVDVDVPNAAALVGTNFAVSECEPLASALNARLAVPLLSGELPSTVAPSRNWTEPTAVFGVTVASSVTVVPWATGPAGVTASAVVVAVGGAMTCSVTGLDVEPVKLFVGVNCAVRLCEPRARAFVVICATPAVTVVEAPIGVDPSLNCTEPVAVDGATVALSVTVLPTTAGFGVTVNPVVVVPGGGAFTVSGTLGDVDPE